MTADDEPRERELVDELLDIENFEQDGRRFIAARIAPHPTAVRTVFEIVDDEHAVPRTAADLVLETSAPYFWVSKYADLLRTYVGEARRRIDLIAGSELDSEDSRPVGQAFAADSAVGLAARQTAIGVRAQATSLATVLFHASQAQGWPRRRDESVALLELFVDATFAAGVLEQLCGQPAIPDDVREAWDTQRDESSG